MNCPNCNKIIDINNEVCPFCASTLYIENNNIQYKKCQFCDNDIEITQKKCPYCKRRVEKTNRKGFSTILLIISIIFLSTYLSLTNMLNYNILGKEKTNKLECSMYASMPINFINKHLIQNNNTEKYVDNTYNFVNKLNSIKTDSNNKKYLEIVNDFIIIDVYLNENEYEKFNTLKIGEQIYFCGTIKEISNSFGAKIIIKNATLM